MELNQYQSAAMKTCMHSSANWTYMSGLLHEEAGELQGKFDKAIRKGLVAIDDNQLVPLGTPAQFSEVLAAMKKELGDVMWACAGIASVLGWSLEDVCQENLTKLAARKEAGTIDGAGDGISGSERKTE